MCQKHQFETRNEIYTYYSSEKQERFKVYFKLTEKFQKCMESCQKQVNLHSDEAKACEKECDSVYDDYKEQLIARYEGENKDKFHEDPKNCKNFTTAPRPDRQNIFYWVMGYDLFPK